MRNLEGIQTPNKIFVFEYKSENHHFVIVVAADKKETARKYVKEKLGADLEPVWLMNTGYPTIYEQNGMKPEKIQAKILYNGHFAIQSQAAVDEILNIKS